MAIFVMTTVGQILFGVMGFMSWWGLPINTTTMINVVISVGFSVDNSAHFCHAFMNAPVHEIRKKLTKQEERNARVIFALNSVGMPILAGDTSTMIALLPLASAQSEIFTSFFKCISLVMIFGASYAVLYLPVVLSTIGPIGYNKIINNNTSDLHNVKQTSAPDDNDTNETNQTSKNKEKENSVSL